MIIRAASAADGEHIAELCQLGGTRIDVAAELARPWGKLWIASELPEQPAQAFLLAWDAADEVHLVDVVTHPDARRRGLGRALVQTLVDHASARRAALIALEVRRSNQAAIALYRAAGFRAVGMRRAYYADGEDAVDMLLDLDPASGAVLRRDDDIEL
ncbi:MAG TPA: GNAT family N-acetyltransferase [Polyangiaceae bacterium]|jgi:ribosomal-protein-alanine N-acetyltransferase|nr:GNAT family N-acetyltransferase [Polyangiaceae bacterium]